MPPGVSCQSYNRFALHLYFFLCCSRLAGNRAFQRFRIRAKVQWLIDYSDQPLLCFVASESVVHNVEAPCESLPCLFLRIKNCHLNVTDILNSALQRRSVDKYKRFALFTSTYQTFCRHLLQSNCQINKDLRAWHQRVQSPSRRGSFIWNIYAAEEKQLYAHSYQTNMLVSN